MHFKVISEDFADGSGTVGEWGSDQVMHLPFEAGEADKGDDTQAFRRGGRDH